MTAGNVPSVGPVDRGDQPRAAGRGQRPAAAGTCSALAGAAQAGRPALRRSRRWPRRSACCSPRWRSRRSIDRRRAGPHWGRSARSGRQSPFEEGGSCICCATGLPPVVLGPYRSALRARPCCPAREREAPCRTQAEWPRPGSPPRCGRSPRHSARADDDGVQRRAADGGGRESPGAACTGLSFRRARRRATGWVVERLSRVAMARESMTCTSVGCRSVRLQRETTARHPQDGRTCTFRGATRPASRPVLVIATLPVAPCILLIPVNTTGVRDTNLY